MSRPGSAEAVVPPEGDHRHDLLARINEREREIERVLEETRAAAAATLADARREAAALILERQDEADRLATQAGERIVGLARREAAAIGESAAREAAGVLATPRERIELAAERLLAIVLPGPPDSGERP